MMLDMLLVYGKNVVHERDQEKNECERKWNECFVVLDRRNL